MVRIAVHPELPGAGYGTRCLELLRRYYQGEITGGRHSGYARAFFPVALLPVSGVVRFVSLPSLLGFARSRLSAGPPCHN